jgi:biopolymer transport protein ExbD
MDSEHTRPRPQLNIAPLIDVVFLLLIFFMLASSFIEQTAIELSMAERKAAARITADPLLVEVAAAGAIRLNGLELALDRLAPELASRAGDRERPVTVRAEARVPVQLLVSVMDRIDAAGLSKIRLATPSRP